MEAINIISLVLTAIISVASSIFITKYQVKSKLNSINRQKWVDEFRDNLALFLNAADMATAMTDIALAGDPLIDSQTAKKLFQKFIIKTSLFQEKLQLYLDPNDPVHMEMNKFVTSFGHEVYTRPNNLLDKESIEFHVGNIRKLGKNIVDTEFKKILSK